MFKKPGSDLSSSSSCRSRLGLCLLILYSHWDICLWVGRQSPSLPRKLFRIKSKNSMHILYKILKCTLSFSLVLFPFISFLALPFRSRSCVVVFESSRILKKLYKIRTNLPQVFFTFCVRCISTLKILQQTQQRLCPAHAQIRSNAIKVWRPSRLNFIALFGAQYLYSTFTNG